MTRVSFPPNKHTLTRAMCRPFRLHVAVAGVALVLTAIVLPVAGAIPLHVLTLALIQSGQQSYYTANPVMTGHLTLNKEYVPPREWNGSQFVPAIVSISAGASDLDTFHMWFNGLYSPFFVVDAVSGAITGPAGYTDVNPWLGVSATGEFSAIHSGGQTSTRVTKAIHFNADDAAPNPGQNDDAVHITKNIHVVLPNAATTTWSEHFTTNPCMGDVYAHSAFFRPDNVSQQNPAPAVNFTQYKVQEGNWSVSYVDESGGLVAAEVEAWVQARSGGWTGDADLDSQNVFPDNNAVQRTETALLDNGAYKSFKNPGVIRLRQGWRTVLPNTSPWWYYEIEYHFIDEADINPPSGKCHTRKQSYSKTSSDLTWVQCPYLN